MRVPAKHPGKIFLVEGFYDRGNHLFLYEELIDKDRPMASFLERGLEMGEVCYHIYPVDAELFKLRRHLREEDDRLVMMPMARKKFASLSPNILKHLYRTLESVSQRASMPRAVRLQLDFGSFLRNGSIEHLLNLERWTHSWDLLRCTTMSVFDLSVLGKKEADDLIRIHDRVTLTTKKGTSVFFTGNSHPSIKIVSKKNMEEWIKKSLEVLVLSLLQQRPMCGIDIIRTISRSFGVEISKGMVYPILYSLRDRGHVERVMEADNKTRLYVPTELGRRFIRKKIRAHFMAQRDLLSYINNINSNLDKPHPSGSEKSLDQKKALK